MDIVVKKYNETINRLEKTNAKMVDNSTYNDRLSICKTCNFYEKYENDPKIFRCTKCGCAGYNIMLQNYQCPLKPTKWKK